MEYENLASFLKTAQYLRVKGLTEETTATNGVGQKRPHHSRKSSRPIKSMSFAAAAAQGASHLNLARFSNSNRESSFATILAVWMMTFHILFFDVVLHSLLP